MQARRRAQPSGTNRPSSYPHPRVGAVGCRALREIRIGSGASTAARSSLLAVRPPGHAARGQAPGTARTGGRSAARRSAATACGARPVPFRTRKLSRTAPMVLRGKPVGEQGAADRWTALRCQGASLRGGPLFSWRGGARPRARSRSGDLSILSALSLKSRLKSRYQFFLERDISACDLG